MGGTDNPSAHDAMEGTPLVGARMTITMYANGAVNVDFPQAPVIAFGMIEEAKRILARHFDAMAQPMIQAPNGAPRSSIMGAIRRNLG